MADKKGTKHRCGCGVGLGNGPVLGNITSTYISETVVDKHELGEKLTTLKKGFKKKLETELRENQMKGVNFIIDKVTDELFDKLRREL